MRYIKRKDTSKKNDPNYNMNKRTQKFANRKFFQGQQRQQYQQQQQQHPRHNNEGYRNQGYRDNNRIEDCPDIIIHKDSPPYQRNYNNDDNNNTGNHYPRDYITDHEGDDNNITQQVAIEPDLAEEITPMATTTQTTEEGKNIDNIHKVDMDIDRYIRSSQLLTKSNNNIANHNNKNHNSNNE